jgi:preprotein translocase subunit SecG
MLSYLKDSQSQIPAVSETPGDGVQAEGSLCTQHDYLTVSGHGRKLKQSTILLIVLFGVGVLGVWFMIKKTTPVKAEATNDDQTQLEAAIAQLNGMQSEMNTQMDSVVGRFYQASSVGQIGVEELKKNPFKRELGGSQVEEDTENQRQQLENNVRRAAAGLQLWSVTSTPRGVCCMINDKVAYVGDKINGLTVTKIADKAVTLELEGIGVQLKIEE